MLGRRKLPMRDLSAILERAGFRSVRTYIQSGNVVFQASRGSARALSARIEQLILRSSGFRPRVLVLSAEALADAIGGNPFPAATRDHKSLHLFFLSEHPSQPDLASLRRLKSRTEAFALQQGVFYLHTPRGFSRSTIREKIERHLGVHATARNWRTVNRLREMSDQRVPRSC